MIKSIKLHKTPKHHGKTFTFQSGINLIRGENSAGKSLIFEFIDYALFGSVALRASLKKYPKDMAVELIFEIRGQEYTLSRSQAKAMLMKGTDSLAVGNTEVTASLMRELGYSRDVFLVSNMAAQEAITHLSHMKPMERKRAIDNVVGLTAAESLIKELKIRVSEQKKHVANTHSDKVHEPEPWTGPSNEELKNALSQQENEHGKLEAMVNHQNTLVKTQKVALNTKPESMAKPEPENEWLELLVVPPETVKGVIQLRKSHARELERLDLELSKVSQKLSQLDFAIAPTESSFIPNFDHELYSKTQLKLQHLDKLQGEDSEQYELLKDLRNKAKGQFSDEEIARVCDLEKQYGNYLQYQSLLKAGTVTCPNCATEVALNQEALNKPCFQHMPEHMDKPSPSSPEMIEHNKTLAKSNTQMQDLLGIMAERQVTINQLESMLGVTAEQVETHLLAEKAQVKYKQFQASSEHLTSHESDLKAEKESLLASQAELSGKYPQTDAQLKSYLDYCEQLMDWDKNQQVVNRWQTIFDALEKPMSQADIDVLVEQAAAAKREIYSLQDQIYALRQQVLAMEDYKVWVLAKDKAEAELAKLNTELEALNLFKAKIKSAILPSVNSVASRWLNEMSFGDYRKVEITEDMDILVNDDEIEVLSVSARALAHFALRMALGQVLTNSIFPVFMADEIDASMRNERAQSVINAMSQMLNGSMKQIIVISHRELENVTNVIEV